MQARATPTADDELPLLTGAASAPVSWPAVVNCIGPDSVDVPAYGRICELGWIFKRIYVARRDVKHSVIIENSGRSLSSLEYLIMVANIKDNSHLLRSILIIEPKRNSHTSTSPS